MDEMDSQYGNIWSVEADEWFCVNGHELGANDHLCLECAEDAYQNGEINARGETIAQELDP
jgi:hypothetical protein